MKNFFSMLLNSLRKKKLEHYINYKQREAFLFFFKTFLLFFFIMFIIWTVQLVKIKGEIQQDIEKFEYLTINVNHSLNESIIFPEKNPRIYVKANKSLKMFSMLINESGFYYRLFGKAKFIGKDLKEYSSELTKILILVAIFIFPYFLIIMFIYKFILALAIILISFVLIFILDKIFDIEIKTKKLFKLGFYASPILFLFMIVFTFIKYSFIAYIIFFIYYLILNFVVSEKKIIKEKE